MKSVLLGIAHLLLASVTLTAQTVPGAIVINGGKDTVLLRSQQSAHEWKTPSGKPFYSNLTSQYQCNVGQTISDGSPVGEEWTQGNVFKSTKTGMAKSITVAIAWVTGQDVAIVTLTDDCGGKPCGKGDGKPALCTGHLKKLATNCTQTQTFKCTVQLTKGTPYWVYAQSKTNSWETWNWNSVGAITRAYTHDGPWTVDGETQGAYSVQ